MMNLHTLRGAALAAMFAGAACTGTINIQETESPGLSGPRPGMARIAITRIEAHLDDGRLLREILNVKLDGSYLSYYRDQLLGVGVSPTVVDVPVGEHTIELEHGGLDWPGTPHGDVAVSVAVTLAEGSYNQILIHGASGAETAKVFLDELRGVPTGRYRARVMNLFDHPTDLSVLACATRESCTTITSDLSFGEMWEDVVDVEIVATLDASSTPPIPLPHPSNEPLPPPVTPGFVTIYGWHASPYDSPPSCPFNLSCDRATVIASYTLSPYWF